MAKGKRDAALTTSAAAALATDQVGVLSTGDVVALSTAQVEALSTQDVAAISTSDVQALAADPVVVLSTGAIGALSTAVLGALSTGDIVVIGTGSVSALSTTQIEALMSGQVDRMKAIESAPFEIVDPLDLHKGVLPQFSDDPVQNGVFTPDPADVLSLAHIQSAKEQLEKMRPARRPVMVLLKNHGLHRDGRTSEFFEAGAEFDLERDAGTIGRLARDGAPLEQR